MKNTELATVGGGCFWCLEPVFEELQGVIEAIPGYAGGTTPHPTYEEVCSGRTGHAEVVQVAFDPDEISYEDVLNVFFSVHDPTTLNRQGADVGTQYRSIILHHSPEQKETAKALIKELDRRGVWNDRIVTEVKPFKAFYPAEPEHRGYFRRNRLQPYCHLVIFPKLSAFRREFADRLKPRDA